ncbi:recombinase family protein [Bacillus sp. T33-2]|uniref:recombinase family protein n=1 Tax=Bacillus sp. T33-2 TaxID=2054168 RepID=UPI000C781DB3|nr:recombinase family protein [Bacillus sp. T33-2]PLR93236.1 recombinase family protein [Bacillus sp. T33-2]
MRAAIYIRVSTEEQAKEGYSISAQKQKLKAYCLAQDWTVAGFYVDEGLSAKDMNRPELQRVLNDIKDSKIDCVLVYRLDRLTRSVLDLYKMLQTFEKYGCKFKSATEVFETTTALGRMFITIVAAMAQWERENTAERVRFGMTEKARQGKWAISLPPFGYDRDGDNLKINEKEASIVKEIFNSYLKGVGMNKLALNLNMRGRLTKKGAPWQTSTIKYVLSNPVYIGTMRWNYRVNTDQYFEVENAVPAIIQPEIFEQVNKIIETRSTNHPRAATSEFIFSGVARCARCGSPLAGTYGYSKRGDKIHRPRSYYCTLQRKGSCDMPNVSERFIETHFLDVISKWDLKQVEFKPVPVEDNSLQERETLEKELSAIAKRRKKWQYLWAEEEMSLEDYRERMNEETEKEKLLREQLNDFPSVEQHQTNETELMSILYNARLNWEHFTAIEKKNFLAMVVKNLKIEKDANRPGKLDSVTITELEFY